MSYVYDGAGKRVREVSSTTNRTFVYDAKGELIANYDYGTPEQLPCTETRYATVDALGSTRMLTDQGGTPQERENYLPFGQSILATSGGPRSGITGYGVTGIRQQFTSKERDSESGLVTSGRDTSAARKDGSRRRAGSRSHSRLPTQT